MLDKDKERATTNRRVKKFWKNNPDKRKLNRLNEREKRRNLIMSILVDRGKRCAICGYNKNYAALDFHHLRDKKFQISQYKLRKDNSLLVEELEKCIVICSNCHRELHNPQCKIV